MANLTANPKPSAGPAVSSTSASTTGTLVTDQRGLVCRHCGCKHFRVIYTRPAWGGRIMRRRECRHCGKRMTTLERPAGQPG